LISLNDLNKKYSHLRALNENEFNPVKIKSKVIFEKIFNKYEKGVPISTPFKWIKQILN
jgi:hypothetical protein